MAIKSFRGKIEDQGIDTISLSTNNGSIGYRIKKFEIMPPNMASTRLENTVKIYSIQQTTATADVDFSDNALLAAAYMENYEEFTGGSSNLTVVFDNVTFNQDIYITNFDGSTGEAMNYHLELEQIKLSLDENSVATLKDIKNIETSNLILE